MSRKFGNVSYPETDFRGLNLRFIAEKKFGKTSFLEAIDNYWRKDENDFTVFIVSVGGEEGDSAIYNLGYNVETFDDFVELVDDVVDNPNDYPAMFAIDTENELIRLCEDYVIAISNKERKAGDKRARSINAAFGGFHKGEFKVTSVIKGELSRLSRAGKGVITNGHTKHKEKVDKTAEDGAVKYEQITSNLMTTYDNAFAEFADIIMIGMYSYVEDDGEITEVKRVISLSSKSNVGIGSGSRFLGMKESIELETFKDDLDAKGQFDINLANGSKIIDTIKTAMADNARARGLTVANDLDHLGTKTPNSSKTPKKATKIPSKSNTEKVGKPKLLKGDELWAVVVKAMKDEVAKNVIKSGIFRIIDVSQAKQAKEMIIESSTTKEQLKELNELVKDFK